MTPLPKAIDSCKMSSVPDVKSCTENIRLSKLLHLILCITNLKHFLLILVQTLSLGDVINLEQNFDLYRDQTNQLFWSEFVVRIQIVATKSIPAAQKCIKKFERDRIYN